MQYLITGLVTGTVLGVTIKQVSQITKDHNKRVALTIALVAGPLAAILKTWG